MSYPYHNSDAAKVEREATHHEPAGDDERMRNNLAQVQTMSPSLFEKVYLGPKTEVKGDLRKIFANPAPLALLVSFVGLQPRLDR